MGLFGIPSKKEREIQKLQILNCRRIFTESMNIMMATDNIDTLLSRRQVLRSALYEAGKIAGENSKCLNGVSPKEALETFDRDFHLLADPCIERYMKKQTERIAKLSRDRVKKAQGLKLIVSNYENEMPADSINYWYHLIDKLVRKIEILERSGKIES